MMIAPLVIAMCALAPFVTIQSEALKPQTPAPTSTPAPKAPEEPAAKSQAPAAGTAKPADAAPVAAATSFTEEQLEQIVAPIALHPDSLLSQILMASTYPLEIVEAHRWVQKNASLTGKALEEALKSQDWDPAVKSICGLPTVLKQMNDSLDWTQDLGDAFLGQKEQLMQTVQKMRRKALEAGTLKSGEQQKITEEGQIIIIESTKTDTVYVPTYYPTAVYGGWSYPYYYYPPMYPPYPAGGLMFGFTVGVIWGGCWSNCNWGGNDIDIDIDHHNEFNRNTDRDPQRNQLDKKAGNNKSKFNHNPEHRKGANYKNPQTAQKYGGAAGSNRVTKDQARGRNTASTGAAQRPAAGTSQRPAAGSRPTTANTPSRTPSAGTTKAGASGTGTRATPKSSGGSGLSGSRSPSADRSASSRGSSSRGSASGGSRGGGSRGGGRGGGGRR